MISKRGYKIYCKQLFEQDKSEYREMILQESLFGDIPTGQIKMTLPSDGEVNEDLDEIEIVLESTTSVPYSLKMKGHIFQVMKDQSYVTYKFMLCSKDFIYKNRNTYLGDKMEDCLSRLYKGNVSSNVKSNVNSYEFHQFNMTDYNYLKYILPSYNKDVVWGFSSEGLVIKKLDKPSYPDYEHSYATTTNELDLSKSKFQELDPPKISKYTYFSSIMYNNEVSYTLKDGEEFQENRMYNIKYTKEPQVNMLVTYGEFPPYELGDVAQFETDLGTTKYVVIYRSLVLNESLNMNIKYGNYEGR